MMLILRVACSQSQRAEEARRMLRTTSLSSSLLILRIALSKGDSRRAQAAWELLKATRALWEFPWQPLYPVVFYSRIYRTTTKKNDSMKSWPNLKPQFDVFLSHNSVDKPWVIKLKNDLQHYGISVWLDRDEIRPGDPIVKALHEGLVNSRAVALMVSPEATASGWVEAEYYRALSLAQNKHSQLIPVILRDAELPGFLEDRNWVDFREESAYSENVWKLVWGITGSKPGKILHLSAPNLASSACVQFARQTEALTANITASSHSGKSERAAMREPSTVPGYALPPIRRIAGNGDGTASDEDEEVL